MVCSMIFGPNDSPLAGREGSQLTGSKIGERLHAEAETSVSLRILPVAGGGESFEVQARGELQLGLLIGKAIASPNVISVSHTMWVCTASFACMPTHHDHLAVCKSIVTSTHRLAGACCGQILHTFGLLLVWCSRRWRTYSLKLPTRAVSCIASHHLYLGVLSLHCASTCLLLCAVEVSRCFSQQQKVASCAENMRREGFELSVSPPVVVYRSVPKSSAISETVPGLAVNHVAVYVLPLHYLLGSAIRG